MCGRYTLTATEAEVMAEFDLVEPPTLRPRYNIAPTQEVPVIRQLSTEEPRGCHSLRWGLIPHWAKDATIGNRMINARSETVEAKPAFRSAFRRQRCLVPASGFFEWQKLGPRKQPHYIHRRDGRVLALAGLWDQWQSPEGDPVLSFTILTTEPNDVLRPLHDRMPVIMAPADYGAWLDPACREAERLRSLLKPAPPDDLVAVPVGTLVNRPSYDAPECIRPLAD